MKICIVCKSLPVHATGGMEIHIRLLVEGLMKLGHKVTIITTKHPEGVKTEHRDGLSIHYVGGMFYKESARLFEKLDADEKFDVVHSQSTAGYGIFSECCTNAKLVVTLHGTLRNEIRSWWNAGWWKGYAKATLLWLLENDKVDRFMVKKADKVIVTSNELRDDVEKEYGVKTNKMVVVMNGIDTEKCRPGLDTSGLRKRFGLGNRRVVLMAAAMTRQKGFHILVKAMTGVHNVKLVLVGDGPEIGRLKQLVKDLGLCYRTVFTGTVPYGCLPLYYNLADVVVFSTLRVEAGALVVPEAMACGKVVIASRIGGVPSNITSYKDGILVEPNNPVDLMLKILEVLRSRGVATLIGENARKKAVERFGVDRMVEETIRVYGDITTFTV